ncbi:MAG: hypothetical protein ITG02_14260 [Patulibacter sp.]|nr:hypothetical protein [Patulibacter sp.]
MSSDDPTPESSGPSSRRAERVEAVRRAVDQAVGATADGTRARAQDLADGTRSRAQDLAEELTQVVVRVRGALEDLGSTGTAQAGAVADEVQQAVGRLGRTLDVRPASADELRRLSERVEQIERQTDQRLARIEARLGIDPRDGDAVPDGTPGGP